MKSARLRVLGKEVVLEVKHIVISVIVDGSKIGCNMLIDGCYIWNNVTNEDGCALKPSILCDGVVMKPGSILEPGGSLICQ